MNQLLYWENRDAYHLKHYMDKVCINCKHCKETSTFAQYESFKKCDIDGASIKNPVKDVCPAFEF